MKKRSKLYCFAFAVLSYAAPLYAENLISVYGDALLQDPTYKQAHADWLSAKENFPIAIAAYLPQVELTGTATRNYVDTHPAAASDGYNSSYGYSATVKQAIFNFQTWKDISGAAAIVKSATATYFSATQDLMSRTAKAYFAVLQADDQLRYTLANKRAVHRQLVSAQQQFKVGLIAITGVYNAKSVYDQTVADEIANRTNLYNALEDLRAITGSHYNHMVGIAKQVPLISLNPVSIDAWVKTAERQNYSLKAQNYAVIAARENIKEQAAARFPTLSAEGTESKTWERDYSANVDNGSIHNWNAGFSLDFTPFQGGGIFAKTSKAEFDYLSAVSKREFAHRAVVNQTRQAYLGVVSGISQIRADQQAIASSKKALEATEAGYQAGTRTMVDVLNDLSALYQARQKHANDQYTYLNSIITLKEEAGTLSYKDLQQINGWLKAEKNLPLPSNLYRQEHFKSVSAKYQIKKSTTHKTRTVGQKRVVLKKEVTVRAKAKPLAKPKVAAVKRPSYTVQIFASTHRTSADRFVMAHKRFSTLEVIKSGRLYKVVSGHYTTRKAAANASQQLPKVLKRYHPWVEGIGTHIK